jgi:Lipocalin-like domain
MNCNHLLLLTLLWSGTFAATAQPDSIVGTWKLIAADKLLPDGTRAADYGAEPHGLVIFTADGYYTVEIYRADRTKFSSGDRLKGTPDEYKEAFLGMSVHFGRYTVDPSTHTISFIIDRASFPNWDGATQVRSYELKGDELSWKVPPRPDGSVPITVLRRVK